MRIFTAILFWTLFVLIKVGESVLWFLRFIARISRMIYRFLLAYLLDVRDELFIFSVFFERIFGYIKRRLFLVFRHLRFRPKKKSRSLSLFSLSWFVKLKYFFLGLVFSVIFIFLPLFFFIILDDLPSPTDLTLQNVPQTTKIYDRNHVLLYEIYANENRTIVGLNQIPLFLREATIATEDKNFYSDPGVDFAAIIRAAWADIHGGDLQGASTITQQLVKVSLLTPKRSIMRKIEEIILALWAEKQYTKDQILDMYLNRVPYGGTAWGVEAAAEVYFNKKVDALDLAQSSFLAGIPQAPTVYSPFGSTPNLWKQRQIEVLQRMRALGYITQLQMIAAEQETLTFESPQIPFKYQHFVMYVRDLLEQKYGISAVEKGGLQVITSLDSTVQDMVQKTVSDEVANDAYLAISNGAALVTNPKNGDILAMIGGRDYNSGDGGNVNLTTALRQPGSSIKIVTYSEALQLKKLTPASWIDDIPIMFMAAGSPPYSPVNYDGKFHGRVTVRTALANSLNIPAVKTLNAIGIPAFLDNAQHLGITTFTQPERYGLSITLGGAEVKMTDMAVVYGTLANMGQRVDLNPFLQVTDSHGNILEKKGAVSGTRVLDSGVAYILSSILSDNNARTMEFGPNSPLKIDGKTVAVKTGTTDDKRDNWTFGYTPHYMVSVWVGNNDNSSMNPALASGITGAAPIWHAIMSKLLKDKTDEEFVKPADIVDKQCNGRVEYFLRGTENTPDCRTFPVSGSGTPIPSGFEILDQKFFDSVR